MATARVTRTLDVPATTLWKLVSSFGDTSWMPGGAQVTLHGSGPGMERRIQAGPDKVIRERLESVDERGRTLVYTIPENVPFPVKDYRATMRVREKGAARAGSARDELASDVPRSEPQASEASSSELDWSVSFEPVGASEAEAAKAIEGMYGVMIGWIEARAKTLV